MSTDHKCKCNHQKSHGNGFLIGVIVGVIVTLLFTTKKGREILKDLTEKGLEKLSDFQKTANEKVKEVKEVASDLEEELVELVEEGSDGDYVASNAIGEDSFDATSDVADRVNIAGSVVEDSFGTSSSEEEKEPEETPLRQGSAGQAKDEKKHKEHKEEHKAEVKEKQHIKSTSNGEAKGPKRFFLRRVRS